MQMKFVQPANYAAFSYNGAVVEGSGLLEHETINGETVLAWCVGPEDLIRTGWVDYTPTSLLPAAREAQVKWIIESNGWSGIEAMTGVEQDALALVLNEAWLEDPTNPLAFDSGTSAIKAYTDHYFLAQDWVANSHGMVGTGRVEIVIWQDPAGQDQATWAVAANVPEPTTILLMGIGLIVAFTIGKYLQLK